MVSGLARDTQEIQHEVRRREKRKLSLVRIRMASLEHDTLEVHVYELNRLTDQLKCCQVTRYFPSYKNKNLHVAALVGWWPRCGIMCVV